MTNDIMVYDLLISCPSDVSQYVELLERQIHLFNNFYGRSKNIIVRSRYWEKDSYSKLGIHPQELLKEHNCEFDYAEEDGLGSIDLIYRGVSYHIWEFADEQEEGVETNLHNAGRSEDLTGSDYEEKLLELLKWRLAS